VQEVAQLGAGEPVGRVLERCVDLLGERVAGGALERPPRGAMGVVPERQRSVEVSGPDLAGVVEQGVGQREPDGVRLGAGADLPGDPGLWLGELPVGGSPASTRWFGEAELAGVTGGGERLGEAVVKPGRLRGAVGRGGRRSG